MREVKEVERDQSITPEDEGIGRFLERIQATDERMGTLNEQAKQLDRELTERRSDWDARTAKLRAIQEREAKEDFARDDRRRMARVAGKTRVIMQEFLTRATERKIHRLSDLITESFRFLLRKQSMVERIHIDPSTFAITLFNEAGHALPRERLSEGEKQIFAISVLWGLARASAHPLPAIIDTPMARLDAAHRRHLVERVLPEREPPGLDPLDRHRGRPALLPGPLAAYRPGVPPPIRRGVAGDLRGGRLFLVLSVVRCPESVVGHHRSRGGARCYLGKKVNHTSPKRQRVNGWSPPESTRWRFGLVSDFLLAKVIDRDLGAVGHLYKPKAPASE